MSDENTDIIKFWVTRRAIYVHENTEESSRNHCCCLKAIRIKCVSKFSSQSSGMQIATYLRSIILPSVPSLVLPYFLQLSHKRHNIRKNFTEHKIFLLIFSTTFVRNIPHSKQNTARYQQLTHVFILVQQLATGWAVRGSNPGGGQDFPQPSKPALRPIQPPIQWVPRHSRGWR